MSKRSYGILCGFILAFLGISEYMGYCMWQNGFGIQGYDPNQVKVPILTLLILYPIVIVIGIVTYYFAEVSGGVDK